MPPPLGRQGRRQGTRRPPPLPPPPPQAQERTEADRRNGGPAPPPKRPLHPGSGGTTAEAGARTPCPLQADGGLAVPRTAETERPPQRPARGRLGREPGRGVPPPPPPPPGRTEPLAADRTAPDARARPATPTARVYPGGARRRQRMAGRRPTGRGGGGGGPPTPPPPVPPPPAWGPQERPSAPLEPRGRPPSPRRDHDARGGGGAAGLAHSAPQRPQPPAPAEVAADRRAHTSAPEQRAVQAWRRRTAEHQNSMEAAPSMTLP